MTTFGIVGFGEVGGLLAARALQAGAPVLALTRGRREARERAARLGVAPVDDECELWDRSGVVLLAVPADRTAGVLACAPASGAAVLDLTSATATVKRRAADALGPRYLDVVITGAASEGNPQLYASGPAELLPLLRDLGFDPVHVSPRAGDAAALKSLWQVVTKGMQALAVETLAAADALGVDYRDPPSVEIDGEPVSFRLPIPLLPHLRTHADRKARELATVVEDLRRAGLDVRLAAAAVAVLRDSGAP